MSFDESVKRFKQFTDTIGNCHTCNYPAYPRYQCMICKKFTYCSEPCRLADLHPSFDDLIQRKDATRKSITMYFLDTHLSSILPRELRLLITLYITNFIEFNPLLMKLPTPFVISDAKEPVIDITSIGVLTDHIAVIWTLDLKQFHHHQLGFTLYINKRIIKPLDENGDFGFFSGGTDTTFDSRLRDYLKVRFECYSDVRNSISELVNGGWNSDEIGTGTSDFLQGFLKGGIYVFEINLRKDKNNRFRFTMAKEDIELLLRQFREIESLIPGWMFVEQKAIEKRSPASPLFLYTSVKDEATRFYKLHEFHVKEL